jgi:hypothetical protein
LGAFSLGSFFFAPNAFHLGLDIFCFLSNALELIKNIEGARGDLINFICELLKLSF